MARKRTRQWVYIGPVKAAKVYQFKAVLLHSEPAIWRRLLVRDDATLEELDSALQIAFGWTNSHLHEFQVGEKRYQQRPPEGFDEDLDENVEDEGRVRLSQLGLRASSKLCYLYDFGDSWEHSIQLERALSADEAESVISVTTGRTFKKSVRTPVATCIAGERSGPLEDCGGVWGWAELCEILADPKHPEHEERKEWATCWAINGTALSEFNPNYFELKPVNADLFKYVKR